MSLLFSKNLLHLISQKKISFGKQTRLYSSTSSKIMPKNEIGKSIEISNSTKLSDSKAFNQSFSNQFFELRKIHTSQSTNLLNSDQSTTQTTQETKPIKKQKEMDVTFNRKKEPVKVLELYNQHVFVKVSLKPEEWPSDFMKDDRFADLAKIISGADAKSKRSAPKTTFFYDPELKNDNNKPTWDLLFYPSSIEAREVPFDQISNLFQEISTNNSTTTTSISKSKISKPTVFICSHGTRDARCGFCGPPIFNALKQIQQTQQNEQQQNPKWNLYECSHIGGHAWAANVLVFHENIGDWFGNITPNDVHLINDYLNELSKQGKNFPLLNEQSPLFKFWRGRLGHNREEEI